jgi:hypothetical protein
MQDGPAGLAAPAKRATSRTFSGNGQIAPGTCAPWRMGTFLLFVWYQVRLGRHSYLPLRDTLKGIHRSCAAFVALNLRPAETSLNHLIDDFFNTFLQILPVHSFEKIELFRAFQDVDTENPSPQSNNQLNLFDS